MLDFTAQPNLADPPKSPWTEDAVTQLKTLIGGGLSCGQIADALGLEFTKNAVISKIHRLGLSGTLRRAAPTKRVRARRIYRNLPRAEKARQQRERRVGQLLNGSDQAVIHDLALELQQAENAIPLGQRCTIMDIDDTKCHWPIGDPCLPDFFFCGGKSGAGGPYCGYHARVAYQPPASRRDRRARA
jgi:GcrA cell cycle regulator